MTHLGKLSLIAAVILGLSSLAPSAEPPANAEPPVNEAPGAEVQGGPGGPLFVAVGYALRRATSHDGISWQFDLAAPEHGQDKDYLLRGVTYGRGRIVAVGGSNTSRILVSDDDGREWRDVSIQEKWLGDVAFGNDRFVAVGYRGAMHSTDGLHWSKPTAVGGVSWRRIVFDAGKFVAIGSPGPAGAARGWRATSVDGVRWDVKPSAGGGVPQEIARGAGRFVVVGDDGFCETSEDGVEWKLATLPEGAGSLTDIVWTGREFLAGDGRAAFRSPDAVEWTRSEARLPSRTSFGGDRFVGCSAGRLSRSTDAVRWTPVESANHLQITKIIYVPAR